MRIKVLFFAQLREVSGLSEQIVELDESLKVGELAERWRGSLPLLYAVNEEFVDASYELRDRDVLALMTPVAGG